MIGNAALLRYGSRRGRRTPATLMSNRRLLSSSIVAAGLAALIALAWGGRAEAQVFGTGGTIGIGGLGTGGTTGTSTFTTSDFFVGVQETPGVNLSTFDVSRFFNVARCNCSEPVTIFISLLPSGIAKRATVTATTGTMSVVLGPLCSTTEGQIIGESNCVPIKTEPVLTFLNMASLSIPTDSRTLSTYLASGVTITDGGTTTPTSAGSTPPCTSPTGQQFPQLINVNFDFDGDSIIDLSVPEPLIIDLAPPPAPTNVKIQGGDEALVMNWTQVDQSITTDLLGYQILCSRADKYQVFPGTFVDGGTNTGGPFGSSFMTCPLTAQTIEAADPTFVCSPLLSAVATSFRVEVLQNDITYAAAVVAIDNSGNASPVNVGFGTPIKTLSFYDVYRDQTPQGSATGGFCAVATSRAGVKSTLGALAVLGLGVAGTLVIRRRRRGGR
jgi:hypothetical protein